jgi:HSP20 family molecular chaperone IbpA
MILHVNVAGFTKEDLKIEKTKLQDMFGDSVDVLLVNGKKEIDGKTYLVNERIRLYQHEDKENITAKIENGLLVLDIPKIKQEVIQIEIK